MSEPVPKKDFNADEFISNLSIISPGHLKPGTTDLDPDREEEEVKNKMAGIVLRAKKLENAGKAEEAIQKMRGLYTNKDELIKEIVKKSPTLQKFSFLFDEAVDDTNS